MGNAKLEGRGVHLGLIRVFLQNGDAEYWATNDLKMRRRSESSWRKRDGGFISNAVGWSGRNSGSFACEPFSGVSVADRGELV